MQGMKSRNRKILATAICLLLGILLIPATKADWSMFQHDSAHQGVTNGDSLSGPLAIKWAYQTVSNIFSSPILVNGVLYVGDNGGVLYALNADTGAQIWNFSTGWAITDTPAVSGDTLFFSNTQGYFYALSTTNGEELWQVQTNDNSGGAFESSPAVSDGGVVYIGSVNGTLFAVNATTGASVWNYETDQRIESSPALAYGLVYFGCDDGNVRALNATNGNEVWSRAITFSTNTRNIYSSPTCADGLVFIGNGGETASVYALDATTGDIVWSYGTVFQIFCTSAFYDGRVYFTTDNEGVDGGYLDVFDALSGELLWNYSVSSVGNSYAISGSPLIMGGTVYFCDNGGQIWAFNVATEQELWHYNMGNNGIAGSPTGSDGTLYVCSESNWVGALENFNVVYPSPPTDGTTEYFDGFESGINDWQVMSGEPVVNSAAALAGNFGLDMNLSISDVNTQFSQLAKTMSHPIKIYNDTLLSFLWSDPTNISKDNEISLATPNGYVASIYWYPVNQSTLFVGFGGGSENYLPISDSDITLFQVEMGLNSQGTFYTLFVNGHQLATTQENTLLPTEVDAITVLSTSTGGGDCPYFDNFALSVGFPPADVTHGGSGGGGITLGSPLPTPGPGFKININIPEMILATGIAVSAFLALGGGGKKGGKH